MQDEIFNKKIILLMKKNTRLLFFFLLTQLFGQSLSDFDANLQDLESIIESASRSSQKVFVEDFTGLL